jgi:CHASE3 domain sensor protein
MGYVEFIAIIVLCIAYVTTLYCAFRKWTRMYNELKRERDELLKELDAFKTVASVLETINEVRNRENAELLADNNVLRGRLAEVRATNQNLLDNLQEHVRKTTEQEKELVSLREKLAKFDRPRNEEGKIVREDGSYTPKTK